MTNQRDTRMLANHWINQWFLNQRQRMRVKDALRDNGFADGFCSVKNEPEMEEKKKLLLDLFLDLAFSQNHPRIGGLPWFIVIGFLESSEHDSILMAIIECTNEGYLLVEPGSPILRLNPERYQETMDYVGAWFEGYEPFGSATHVA